MIEWIFQTSWYIITITMVVVFIAWDVTGTRKDDEEDIKMYKYDMILKRYEKNGILLGDDSRWLLKATRKLIEMAEFYGNDANWLPVQYGSVIENEVDRDGGERAKEILTKLENEE